MYQLIPSNMTWLEVESLPPSLEYWPGLANFILVNILCSIATASLPLRLYTYLCLTKRKGGWALIWTTVAWTIGIPSILIMDLGTYYPELNWNSIYLTTGFVLLQLSASFARLGILAYIVEMQAQIYRTWKYVIGSVVMGNFVLFCLYAVAIWLKTVCLAFRRKPGWSPHIVCPGQKINPFLIVMNAWGGMTDLMLGIYPGFLIRNLRIPLKTKILTCCLMGLGVIASAFGFGKVGWLSVDIHNGTKAIPPSVAFFFYGEAWLLVVTTSIAPLWPLIKRLKWTRKHDKSVGSIEAVESMES